MKGALERAFSEVHDNPPSIVRHTREKFGPERARKQQIAIALDKARRSYAGGGQVRKLLSSVARSVDDKGWEWHVFEEMGLPDTRREREQVLQKLGQNLGRRPPTKSDLHGKNWKAIITIDGGIEDDIEQARALARQGSSGKPTQDYAGGGSVMMNAGFNSLISPRVRMMAGRRGMPAQGGMRGTPPQRFAEGGSPLGGEGLLAKRKAYNQYVIEMQEQGDAPLTFAQWLAEQGSGVDDLPVAGEAPAPATPQREPIIDTIMNKLRSLKFANGGAIDPRLYSADYYQSDLIPPETAGRAAHMAQQRDLERAMRAGTGSDDRERLRQLRALIARIRAGQGVGGEMPEVGSRRELLQRTQRYAGGGSVRHISPGDGGFSHAMDDVMFYRMGGQIPRYAGGGPIGMPMPGMAPGAPQPTPMAPPGRGAGGVDQPVGALAKLGQQLLSEREALQQTWRIPPPASPQGPQPGAGAGAPQMPGPQMGGVQQGLQDRLTPNFFKGGPVSGRVLSMAARDPRLGMRLTRCGGGRV